MTPLAKPKFRRADDRRADSAWDCSRFLREAHAIRYEYGSAIRFNRVTSTGSGTSGFYSSKGTSRRRDITQLEPPIGPRTGACGARPRSRTADRR